jgi:hypothetical protein
MAINRDDHQSVSQMICFHQRARQPLLQQRQRKKKKKRKNASASTWRQRAKSKRQFGDGDNHRKFGQYCEQHTYEME